MGVDGVLGTAYGGGLRAQLSRFTSRVWPLSASFASSRELQDEYCCGIGRFHICCTFETSCIALLVMLEEDVAAYDALLSDFLFRVSDTRTTSCHLQTKMIRCGVKDCRRML